MALLKNIPKMKDNTFTHKEAAAAFREAAQAIEDGNIAEDVLDGVLFAAKTLIMIAQIASQKKV